MKYHSRYAAKRAKRFAAQKVVRNVLVNKRNELVGPNYGMEFRYNHETEQMEGFRNPDMPIFAKEIRVTPFAFEL